MFTNIHPNDLRQKRLKQRLCVFMAIFSAAITLGCSDTPKLERIAVSGKVTHNNEQVKRGEVFFIPAPGHAAPTAGPVAIQNGRYELPADKGPVAGKYLVCVKITSKELDSHQPGKKLDNLNKDPAKILDDSLKGKWEIPVTIIKSEEDEEKQGFQFDVKLIKKYRESK